MKQIKFSKINVRITNGMYLYLALLLLLIPIRLLLAAVISGAIHELFHIAAVRFVGKEVYSVCIAPRGTIIQTQSLNDREEALCAIAGPVSGFLLFLLFRWIPMIALTGVFQSLYNLLPLYPTDGGRVLQSCIRRFFPTSLVHKVIYWTEIVTLSAIMAVGLYGSLLLNLGIIPALFAVSMLLKSAKLK